MKYKVVSKNNINELWASGFYGDNGKLKAQKLIDTKYFNKFMYEKDKNKELIVIEDKQQ